MDRPTAPSTMIIICMGLRKSGLKVLVDTSAWLALRIEEDACHSLSVILYELIKNAGWTMVTTDGVFSETLTRLRYDSGFRAAREFHKTIEEAAAFGSLGFLWSTPGIFKTAWDIMEKYHDHKLSFVDCTLAAHARTQNIRHIFTFDKDFATLGFTLLNKGSSS